MKKIIGLIAIISALTLTGCDDIISEIFTVFDESSVTAETVTEPTAETSAEQEVTTEITTELPTESATEPVTEEQIFDDYDDNIAVEYSFRTKNQLEQHFDKHGGEFDDYFGYDTPEKYEAGANDVINNPDALYKTEKEDGDGVYYLEDTNEFVILSTDGYIRTYFRPTAGIDYFNRQ